MLRVAIAACLVAACGTEESQSVLPSRLRCEMPVEPVFNDPSIFETATAEPGPQDLIPARLLDGKHFVGAAFTTTSTSRVTGLGAQIYTTDPYDCDECTQVQVSMSVLALDPITKLPKTNSLADAICWTVGTVPSVRVNQLPEPLASTTFPVDFLLPAGDWGVVIATNRFSTQFRQANLPLDVTPVGTPDYFGYSEAEDVGAGPETGHWEHTDPANGLPVRIFVVGH